MTLMCNQDLDPNKMVDYDSKEANENACIHQKKKKGEWLKKRKTNCLYP